MSRAQVNGKNSVSASTPIYESFTLSLAILASKHNEFCKALQGHTKMKIIYTNSEKRNYCN